jgi:hypothetical protein
MGPGGDACGRPPAVGSEPVFVGRRAEIQAAGGASSKRLERSGIVAGALPRITSPITAERMLTAGAGINPFKHRFTSRQISSFIIVPGIGGVHPPIVPPGAEISKGDDSGGGRREY